MYDLSNQMRIINKIEPYERDFLSLILAFCRSE